MEKYRFRKNEQIEHIYIEDIGIHGEGVGKIVNAGESFDTAEDNAPGYTLFIKDAVLGDVVTARLTKVKASYAYAKMEVLEKPSPYRVASPCPVARQCGGCQLSELAYAKQLEWKEHKVRDALSRIGGFSEDTLSRVTEPIVGMEEPWRYRNKAQFPVGSREKKEGQNTAAQGTAAWNATTRNTATQREIITGFYAGRTHDIIPTTECYLGSEKNKEILERILAYMRENHVEPYDEQTGRGLVRHILLRNGRGGGAACDRKESGDTDGKKEDREEHMVCIVLNGKELPQEKRLIASLRAVKGMTSISVSENTARNNVIMGKTYRTLWGRSGIKDVLRIRETSGEADDALTFAISPLSFYQVNPKQTEKLYSLALSYAELTGKETVWDLYCGIGTISLFFARKAKKVYGVEVVPQAIDDARENARLNGIANAEFIVGKAEEILPRFYGVEAADRIEENAAPDVIVVDPPRKGCDERLLNAILRLCPKRIVYVSCDPATLARDLRLLCADNAYALRRVRPVDQFPQTGHVETVVLLTRQNT